MNRIIDQTIYYLLKAPIIKFRNVWNSTGNQRKCIVCNRTFRNFLKWKGGSAKYSKYLKALDAVGSDVDNFGCPYCSSFDRERHLILYFEKLGYWEKISEYDILHFGPAKHFSNKITSNNPRSYIKADLTAYDDSYEIVDATNMQFEDHSFDLLIMNHVLEHIVDYKLALKEIFRVLKPEGIAILQTPYSKMLENNFEDTGINTDELKDVFYGQRDHVRWFSEKQFLQSITEEGFELKIVRHAEVFEPEDAYRYGVNRLEDLIRVVRPND